MATISHRAFLDVERALTGPVAATWRKTFEPVGMALGAAAKARNWGEVDKLIDTIKFEAVVEHGQLAATVAVAAYLLGVSRVRELGDEVLSPDTHRRVGNMVAQWGYIMTRDLVARVHRTLHKGMAKIEHRLTRGRVLKAHEIEEEEPDW